MYTVSKRAEFSSSSTQTVGAGSYADQPWITGGQQLRFAMNQDGMLVVTLPDGSQREILSEDAILFTASNQSPEEPVSRSAIFIPTAFAQNTGTAAAQKYWFFTWDRSVRMTPIGPGDSIQFSIRPSGDLMQTTSVGTNKIFSGSAVVLTYDSNSSCNGPTAANNVNSALAGVTSQLGESSGCIGYFSF